MSFCDFLLLLSVFKLTVSVENIWYPYQFEPIYLNREEFSVTSITSNDRFKLNYEVKKWKSICLEKVCNLAGLLEKKVVVVSIKLNSTEKNGFLQESFEIELPQRLIDVVLFQNWNTILKKPEVIAAIATQNELNWYRIYNSRYSKFWSWPFQKNISHINIFQKGYDKYLLVINEYYKEITADLYEIQIETPNFWLRQKLPLTEVSSSSTAANVGPDFFIAIPQKTLNLLLLYKFVNNHFISYQNFSSNGIDEVISFKMGAKSFLAFDGMSAGIYRFNRYGLVRENVTNSHFDYVNYWLPILVTKHDETILIAQRSLSHGIHKSFVIEIITYNGDKFEEHEDIPCSYFGEDSLGLSCLPGLESANGIIGATSFAIGDVLGLVVPRQNSPSELFLITTTIRNIENPMIKEMEELVKMKEYLDNLITSQQNIYNEIVAGPQQLIDPKTLNVQLDEMKQELNSLKQQANSNEKSVHYTNLIFNDYVEIFGDAIFDNVVVENISGESAEDVLNDFVLKNNVGAIAGPKTFSSIEVENLSFENVNGIDRKDLLFGTKNITINGDVILEEPLMIFGDATVDKINGLSFENEIVDFNTPVDELIFEEVEILNNVKVDQLNDIRLPLSTSQSRDGIPSILEVESFPFPLMNVIVDNVNGENFEEFLKQLCLKNIKTYIPGTTVIKGNVTVKEMATTDFLNDLKFLEEYVFNINRSINITGFKTFANTLKVSDVRCERTINGINPFQIITLTTDQFVPGTTTFKNLKISEKLQVLGNVTGEHASKFLPNPTLLDTNNVTAKVNFKNLEVEGSIILSGRFNGHNFYNFLSNVVYSDEESVVIEGMKQFMDRIIVQNNLEIQSNSINEIDLDTIVTKNTPQILNMTSLKGTVSMGNMETQGLYDGVNVTALDEELVKLDGEQYISSSLVFGQDLVVDELEILETINDIDVNDFLQNNNNLDKSFDFNELNLDKIEIYGNLTGTFENFDVDDFERRRLSFTKDQTMEGTVNLENAFIKNLSPFKINDVDSSDLSRKALEDHLNLRLLLGQIEIGDLFIDGSMDVVKINNQAAVDVGGSLWMNDIKKHNLTTLHFRDDVYFDEVQIEKLSSVDFTRYLKNLVFKNETDVTLAGKKTFLDGITVKKFIETQTFNNVSIDNILTIHGKQEIFGPLIIEGNVDFANTVTITDSINNLSVDFISANYAVSGDEFVLKGDVMFDRLPHIYNLNIQGFVDDQLVQPIVDDIIYKNSDFKMLGQVVFGNNVALEGNVKVMGEIDGVDLSSFMSNVVMITKDVLINSQTQFEEYVVVEDKAEVDTNIETVDLNGINFETWKENAIYVDKGFLEGNYFFEDVTIVDTLQADFINNVDMSTLIPLRTDQNLAELSFDEVTVFNDVEVGNLTNGFNLREEYENTVFINPDQNIESDIEFLGDVFIEGDMELMGLLNGMETNRIVTTNTDQELSAIYDFKAKTNIEQNLFVTELVNGINITDWYFNRIKLVSKSPQTIQDDWIIEEDLVFENEVEGKCPINGVDLEEYAQDVAIKRKHKYALEKGFIDDYATLCKDVSYMHDKLKRQIYKFDYFEILQMLEFRDNIQYVHHFEYQNKHYVLINEHRNCNSHIFMFDSHFRFVRTVDFGLIAQIIQVRDSNLLYLVIRNQPVYSLCKVQGTNLWQVIDDGFVHLANVENQDLLQESMVPGEFYSLRGFVVTEYKITPEFEPILRKYRKWSIKEQNMAFVPRGLATGLALRTGGKLIRLYRDDPIEIDFSYDTENIIRGNFSEEFNTYLPGRKDSDLVVMSVGVKSTKRNLLAVASHEETSVRGNLDFIKIYEDVVKGKVFHKVATYKPSSLVSLEFHNGETLLAFMEDESVLQVYEYKGIEGFKHKLSAKLEASKLLVLTLRREQKEFKLLGVLHKNRINFVEAMMLGNQIERDLQCSLL